MRLRDYCRKRNLRLSEVAYTVTTNAASLPDLTSP